MFAIFVALLASCGGGSASHNIKTADQWVEYCDNESNIHRCLKTFDGIDPTYQRKIWDELTIMVAHLRLDDVKGRIKKDAWGYLIIYAADQNYYSNSPAFFEYTQSDEGKGQYSSGGFLKYKRDADVAFIVVGGGDGIDKLMERYKTE